MRKSKYTKVLMKLYNKLSQLKEEEQSPLQKEYSDYFNDMMDIYDIDSPADLKGEEEKEFYNSLKTNWTKDKGVKDGWEEKVETQLEGRCVNCDEPIAEQKLRKYIKKMVKKSLNESKVNAVKK